MMRLGLFQSISPAGDLANGMDTIASALRQAAQSGVDMLTLPELFLPGYNSTSQDAPNGWAEVKHSIARLCKSHCVALTIGLPEYTAGKIYNTAFAFGSDGTELTRYRKVQLFGPREKALFARGDAHVVFDYNGTRFGLLICYDVEFPEHCRALARAGVEAVLVPTANMMPFLNVNRVMVPSRACENAMTVVYANYCGQEGDLTYSGHSLIAGPEGQILAACGVDQCLLVADLPTKPETNGIPYATQLADYIPARAPKD
jgi:5-aminopentanamidase